VRIEGRGTPGGAGAVWAYGGANGQRGARDGDIGTERVPISEYFQLSPEYCRGNTFETAAGSFTMKANGGDDLWARGRGGGCEARRCRRRQWATPDALLGSAKPAAADLPVVVGRMALAAGEVRYLSLQRLGAVTTTELQTYRDVTASRPGRPGAGAVAESVGFCSGTCRRFLRMPSVFQGLRERVAVDTPDPYLNAAGGSAECWRGTRVG